MQSKAQKEFYQALDEQIIGCDLPQGCNRWLLGISGGCDSMGLVYGLVGLRELYPERFAYLHVAHLNHQLRGADSDADAAFVVEQARNLDLPVTVSAVDIGAAAENASESIETAARNQRYQFLAETARQWECQVVATGHNADDNAETILHRIIRGTGIRGLRGIPAIRPMENQKEGDDLLLVRPLLSLRRTEIETFLTQKEIEWRQDASNDSAEFTRNRIRHELTPYLNEHFNPRVTEALLRLGQAVEMFSEVIDEIWNKELGDFLLELGDNLLILDAALLAEEPFDRQHDILFQALAAMEVPLGRIGGKHFSAIFQLIKNSPCGHQTYHYPGGLRVQRDEDRLIFRREANNEEVTDQPVPKELILPLTGAIDVADDFFRIDPTSLTPLPVLKIYMEQVSAGDEYLPQFRKSKTSICEIFDLDRVQGQLRLKVWEPGDRFLPLGMTGEKTLGDFFTDMKVPAPWRSRVGLICDERNILWVLGLRISHKVKITPNTSKILKLTLI